MVTVAVFPLAPLLIEKVDVVRDPVAAPLGAIISGMALLLGAGWPSQLGIFMAVWIAGIGYGMVRGPRIAVAMSIAETDLVHLGSKAVLGSLRTLGAEAVS